MTAAPAFTIGTLVTQPDLYATMQRSFEAGGFVGDVEWLTIDNTGPDQTDAYAGLNQILGRAAGRNIILCHQDLLLLSDGRAVLEARLAELDAQHPEWGLAGNAGGAGTGRLVRRISDKRGADQSIGTFPHRVMSLDENFIVVRGGTRIGFSRDLNGFHMYGADICLVADILGHSAWVIDFHLRHLGNAAMGPSFIQCQEAFRRKWSRALRDRHMQTTCAFVALSGQNKPDIVRASEEYLAQRVSGWRRSIVKRVKRVRQGSAR